MPGLSSLLNLEPEQIKEMAMVDLAYRLLTETKKPYKYVDLYGEISQLKNLSEEEMKTFIAQIYTEINLDGRFLCLGDGQWGLKRWYLVETQEETAEGGNRRKYLDDDDDFDDDEVELEEDFEIEDISDDIDRLGEEDDEDEEEEEEEFDDEAEDVVDTELEEEAEDEDLDTV